MVEIAFKFTPDAFTDALNHYHRQTRNYISPRLELIFAIVTIPIFTFGIILGDWLLGSVMLLAVLVLLGAQPLNLLLARRWFAKSPFYNADVVQRFDESGLHETTGISEARFDWSAFTKVVHFEDGFLLFHGPKVFRWIPVRLLANSEQVRELRELLDVNVPNHRIIAVVKET